MKLKVIRLLLLTTALMLLVGCGGDPQPTPTATPNIEATVKVEAKGTPTPVPAATPLPTDTPEATRAPIATSTPIPAGKASVTGSIESVVPKANTSGANWNHLTAAESYRRISPPNAKAINLEYDEIVGKVRVIGNPGAVLEESNVMVANLELGGVTLVVADSSGAFEASVPARPGTHVLVKQDTTGHQVNFINGANDQLINEGAKSPGVILSIPVPETKDGYGFAGGGRVPGKDTGWVVEGNLSRIAFQDGDRATIDGNLSILTGIQKISDQILGDIRYDFTGQIIGDGNGLPMGPGGTFASNILTPTGLPILTDMNNVGFFNNNCAGSSLNWRQEEGKSVSDFSCDVNIDTYGGTPDGTYILWLTVHFPENIPNVNESGKLLNLGTSGGGAQNMVALATVAVGSPKPMRLATTLFADLLQEGTRGGVWPQENKSQFGIGPLTITNHNPVIPRLDPYGDSLSHRLDPYAPLLGMVDRITPSVPFVEFDFSNSELQINVERPDGKVDVLGPAPLGAYGVRTPILPDNRPIAGGGGHIVEIPQLLGLGDEFVYEFPLDGDYVLKLSGHVNDTNGYIFEIGGSYDVSVANSLDIETMLLPGTPFEVGGSLPVGLHVYPQVPAKVDFTVTHVGADNVATLQQYKGVANESGYWDGEGKYFTFENAGEYKIDVEARYTSEDGALWVGRLVHGSAIATPDGPIIAHGRRGPDNIGSISPPWGFGSDFEPGGHHQFPFFTGDILWGIEGPDPNREEMGPGDSVNTQLSFQALDTNHPLVARAIKQVPPDNVGGGISSFVQTGQIPLATFAELNPDGSDKGLSLGFRPEQLNLRAYSYTSAQRPGVRVRELIQGNDVGIAYWRFNDAYHMQSGNGHGGDLPGDFKFLYGATVIRDTELKEGIFAIYGSGWVLARNDDSMGSRFMPPFQGNAGGPNGGPLFNVHGRDVDMFFLPLGVRPGSVLEVGDIFRMAGPVMPTLPSKVEYEVTAPDGTLRAFKGRANSVGYYYDPADDFKLDQPGLWTVELAVTHDGMTSAGPVQKPYPNGGPLTPDGRTFTFIVTDNDTQLLNMVTDLTRRSPLLWYAGTIQNARFEAPLPQGWTGETAHLTATMPGIVLVEKDIQIEDGVIKWSLKGEEMNRLANNFDHDQGLADTITVTYYAGEQSGRQAAGTIVTHGARVPLGLPYPPSGNWPTGQTSCLQSEIELFASDFERDTEGWSFNNNKAWSIVQTDGSNVLRGVGQDSAYASGNWDEVIWRMRVKLITGHVHLNFHNKDGRRYLISFGQGWTVSTRSTDSPSDVSISASVPHSLNKWHVVEISLFEKVLRVGVNGVLEIEQPDSTPLPPGGIWLENHSDSEVLFDDIHICKPNG
jgi:hypothetical protein